MQQPACGVSGPVLIFMCGCVRSGKPNVRLNNFSISIPRTAGQPMRAATVQMALKRGGHIIIIAFKGHLFMKHFFTAAGDDRPYTVCHPLPVSSVSNHQSISRMFIQSGIFGHIFTRPAQISSAGRGYPQAEKARRWSLSARREFSRYSVNEMHHAIKRRILRWPCCQKGGRQLPARCI